MKRTHQFLALLAGGMGVAAALLGAPSAAAEPLQPSCQDTGGGDGAETTVCTSPGNAEIVATPNDLGEMAADSYWGLPYW